MSSFLLFWLAVLVQLECVTGSKNDSETATGVVVDIDVESIAHHVRSRRLRTISLEVPDSMDDIDWVGLAIAIIILWILLCCLCNALQCILACLGCGGRGSYYTSVPSAPRSVIYGNGGGGSYNSGTSQTNQSNVRTGNGRVIISW